LIGAGVFRAGAGVVRFLLFGVAVLPIFLLFAILTVLASLGFLAYNYKAPSLPLPFRYRSISASTFTTAIVFLVIFFIFSVFLGFVKFSEFLLTFEVALPTFDFVG